jgi:hypothetical protein
MSIHQQIAEACSHDVVMHFTIEPSLIDLEFDALPDCN